MYDIIIIGAGPAGLTAAIYARRAGKTVLVIEKDSFGGQMTYSPKIENYPAYKQISGSALADMMVEQALELGADFEAARVTSVRTEGDVKAVGCDDGTFEAKSVIIAAGVRHRMLGLEGEAELIGHGISFCAVCDGAFYRDRNVAVIGGGNSAMQEALLLCEQCRKVTVVQNLDFFTGEAALLERLRAADNAELITGTVVSSLQSEGGHLTSIEIEKSSTGEKATLSVDAMFTAVGLMPENDIFGELAELDAQGYIKSDESCMTKTDGVFVCGDCRSKKIRQITTACGDGATAALAACAYIDNAK